MNTKITFYPVLNGDCTLIEFSNGLQMMFDCNFRGDAEDDNKDDYDVIKDLLDNKLKRKYKGLPYLDAYVLTHPDQDHCRGFKSKFFQGNKVKLQLADYQLTAIFFCQIRTTFAQQNLKIPLKIHRRSPPIQRQKLISQFLTPYNLRNSEQREAEVSCRCCGNISHDHSGAEALPGRLCQRKPH